MMRNSSQGDIGRPWVFTMRSSLSVGAVKQTSPSTMPKTCCSWQPSPGRMRRALDGFSLAPPTCSSRSEHRSAPSPACASSHSSASGGTSAVAVTRWRAIRSKQIPASGSGATTTVPPAISVPRKPGQAIGKLCIIGSTQR